MTGIGAGRGWEASVPLRAELSTGWLTTWGLASSEPVIR